MSGWTWLIIAIFFEVGGTTALKLSNGLSKWIPTLFVILFYGVSFSSLAVSLKTLEVGVAYAIWAGVGTALIAIMGVLVFGEAVSLIKFASVGLIILGVVGLKLIS